MTRLTRPLLALLFLALLATPFLIRRYGPRAPQSAAGGDALQRYGFQLTESANGAGIYFQHEGPTLDPKLNHIMPQIASMGAAVSIVASIVTHATFNASIVVLPFSPRLQELIGAEAATQGGVAAIPHVAGGTALVAVGLALLAKGSRSQPE